MKKIIFLALCFLYHGNSFALEPEVNFINNKTGLSVSTSGDSEIGGYGTKTEKKFYLGLNYLHSWNRIFDFETGVEFSDFSINIFPIVAPCTVSKDFNGKKYGNLILLDVPLITRVNLSKYVYFNGGALLDLDVSKSSNVDVQNGIGFMFGVGLKYCFKSGLEISVNPNIKEHSFFSFSQEDKPYRLFEKCFKFSILLPLKHPAR